MKGKVKRLFTGFEIPPVWQEAAGCLERRLLEEGVRARFVPAQRLHLTLNFIGETDREEEIIQVLEDLDRPDVPLIQAGRIGLFRRRRGGDLIVWHMEADPDLEEYQKREREALEGLGLVMDKRPYRPHLTLAREARGAFLDSSAFRSLSYGLPPLEPRALFLFWSDREGGRLVYRPVRFFAFGKES